MLEKEKFYKKKINKKITLYILFFYLFSTNLSYSNNQQKLVKNLEEIKFVNYQTYMKRMVEENTDKKKLNSKCCQSVLVV